MIKSSLPQDNVLAPLVFLVSTTVVNTDHSLVEFTEATVMIASGGLFIITLFNGDKL